jgi:hypothetical protein
MRKVALHHGAGAAACLPPHNARERCVAVAVGDRRAHRHRQPAVRREYAPHLAQRCNPVREEHQRKLADDDIEGTVLKGQLRGIALPPIDLRAQLSRDSQHALI